MDGAVRGENGRLARSEGQTDQALAGDFEVGLAVRSDLHDAALSGKRGGDIDIAFDIQSQALRTSQPAVNTDTVPWGSTLYTQSKLEVLGAVTNISPCGPKAM